MGHFFSRLPGYQYLGRCLLGLGLLMNASNASSAEADWPESWQPALLSRTLSFELDSRYTGQRYRILLGLPHAEAPPEGYPVLWMLDGLGSFPLTEVVRPRPLDPDTNEQWRQVHGMTPAGLTVAVGYASGKPFDVDARALDYTPVPTAPTGDGFSNKHGGAENFLKFLVEELRPILAEQFALNPQRHTLFGFSYGALFTVYTFSHQPEAFQRYWAASPSLWFGGETTRQLLLERLKTVELPGPTRLTLTVGRDEQYPATFANEARKAHQQSRAMVDNVQAVMTLLQQRHLADLQLEVKVVADHDHLDMLLHGARRVVEFAFEDTPSQGL